jgi:hypothetical protein
MTHAEALALEAEGYRRKVLARIHELNALTARAEEFIAAGHYVNPHPLVTKARAVEEAVEIWRAGVHAAKTASA